MNSFYRYIYPHHNGYQIKRKGVHYGWYDDIRWALHDRDKLEECNWDYGEFVFICDDENKYLGMRLPPRDVNRWRQYVYPNGKSWRIAKRVNGELRVYGTFKTLEEALDKRDELIDNNWEC